MIKQVFLTFRFKNIGNLTLQIIGENLTKLDKYASIIGVEEFHKNYENKHFHVLVIFKNGISKKLYRSKIRDLFPLIKGHGLDISGVRNIKFTVKYILKNIRNPKDIFLLNIRLEEFVKMRNNYELMVYFSILNFEGRFDDWKSLSLDNRLTYYNNSKKTLLIWDDVQKSKIKRFSNLKSLVLKSDVAISKDIGFLIKEIPFSHCTLLIKFCVSLFSRHEWKRTNILLSGIPNTGKTSFFKKFEMSFGCRFYWAPSRIGDLSGFDSKHGLIILDDVISYGNKWPIAMLLKMLGSEGFKGDIKIRHIVDIPAGIPAVVITNFPEIFTKIAPLAQRLMHISLTERFSWFDITNDQFKLAVYIAIDGVKNMSNEDLKFWNYNNNGIEFTKKQLGNVSQLQLAINSIISESGNSQNYFPENIINNREIYQNRVEKIKIID